MINFANLSLKAVRILAVQPALDRARAAGTGPDVLDVVSPVLVGMSARAFTIGVDFGTSSVRALVVDCEDGRELGTRVFDYPSGDQGVLLDPKQPHLARQNPADYIEGLRESLRGALLDAERDPGLLARARDRASASTRPGRRRCRSMPRRVRWRRPAMEEQPGGARVALEGPHVGRARPPRSRRSRPRTRPSYLAPIGGTYSSEWWWSKIWHCLQVAPDVFDAAASWVELADFVPALLAGVNDSRQIVRCICAAGHKAMYSDAWGGLPSKAFLTRLDPKLAELRDRLYDKAWPPGHPAGRLSRGVGADARTCRAGIAIAMGGFDAHYGAVGSGVRTGTLVKIIGTSTCDCADRARRPTAIADIPGICGIVNGSILPGYFGIEAGQSAVGDLLKWWVEGVCQDNSALHADLSAEATRSRRASRGSSRSTGTTATARSSSTRG